jgi:hypothetical protein
MLQDEGKPVASDYGEFGFDEHFTSALREGRWNEVMASLKGSAAEKPMTSTNGLVHL